jgi:uncharacterized protein (TIGR03067 family)
MSWLRTLVLGVGLVAVSAAAAQDDKKTDKLDAAKLAGTYKITGGKNGGEKLGDDAMKGSVIFTKETIVLKGADGMDFEFTYKLDAKADPAEIDMEMTKPDALKGTKAQGIIGTEGGEVKLCYNPDPEKPGRPKKFESTKENGYHLIMMKKEKADEKKPKAVADK